MRYLFSLILVMFFFGVNAQKKDFYIPIYRDIIVVKDTGSCKLQVKVKIEKKVKPKNGVTYFWYANDKVHSTEAGFDGILLDGTYREFDKNENLTLQGEFIKGLKTGVWKKWYPNGKLKEEANWKDGKLKGRQLFYDEKGMVIQYYLHTEKQKKDLLEEWAKKEQQKQERLEKLLKKDAEREAAEKKKKETATEKQENKQEKKGDKKPKEIKEKKKLFDFKSWFKKDKDENLPSSKVNKTIPH